MTHQETLISIDKAEVFFNTPEGIQALKDAFARGKAEAERLKKAAYISPEDLQKIRFTI